MGNVYYWIGATGSQGWAVGANWLKDDNTTGTVPGGVAGDSAFVMQGNSDINTSLTAPANALTQLIFGGVFAGTVGTTGNSSDSLPMLATTWTVNCDATRIKLDFGASNHIGYILATGDSADDGLEAVRIRGGNTASQIIVTGGTVGVGTTRPGITATLASFSISGGTLNVASGVTVPNGTQSGGDLTVNCGMSGTLAQNDGTLTTGGTALIATINVGGTATLNHRPAAGTSGITTLTIEGNSTADVSQDPQSLQVANPIVMYGGSTFKAFSAAQVTLPSSAPLQIELPEGRIDDVTIDVGRVVRLTIAAG